MSNKLFNGNNTDYFVEDAKDKGYLKKSGKGYGDGQTSSPVKDYDNRNKGDSPEWFEGKKGNVGSGMRGPQGKL